MANESQVPCVCINLYIVFDILFYILHVLMPTQSRHEYVRRVVKGKGNYQYLPNMV